jgi:6-pyruvoyltetrahydropterin/6-carboxytetrahydropterin synthase
MYTISVQAHYDSAHLLRDYEGKCARLHGHRYVVQVVLQAPSLGKGDMVYDFGDLKGHLRKLADGLDHQFLNDIPPFTEIESTAENQARYFFEEVKKCLPKELAGGLLYARVSESPGQWAQYGPGPEIPDPGIPGEG